ncbi:MAG: hypothetical protein KGJ59_14190, partial [Bacteroidota bacterium]|nr:hypothetical protein [Bacteroidota bacterium]
MAKISTRLHVHCQTAITTMSPILNAEPGRFFVMKLPEYPAEIFPQTVAKHSLQKRYPEIHCSGEQKIFLMLGEIAEYKGLIEVAEIFANSLADKILIIVGPLKRWDRKYVAKLL